MLYLLLHIFKMDILGVAYTYRKNVIFLGYVHFFSFLL